MQQKCDWCSQMFETDYVTKLYCNRQHKWQAKKHRQRDRTRQGNTITKMCSGCALPFRTHHSQVVYCSQDCRLFYTKRRRKETRKALVPKRLTKILLYKSNGNCAICHEPIDTSVEWPNRRSFSIDHIIPISKNGSDEINNLQATHLRCNMQKGTKT